MGFNFNVFSAGGGGGSGSGIAKYATAGALPGTAADGDVAIVLDTNNLYSYDTGVPGWVIIGGPGVAVTVSDTDSIDTAFSLNDISSNLRIPPGITGIGAGFNGITLSIFAGASPGLVAQIQGFPVYGSTANAWDTVGSTAAMMGATLKLVVRDASASNPGLMTQFDQTFSGIKYFNNSVVTFSVFALVDQGGGPGTINIQAPATVSPSYTWLLPATKGLTFSYMMTDGLGGATWSQISPTFLIGITGPIIATGPGIGTAVMQSRGLTLGNFPLIDPTTFLGNNQGSTAGVTTLTMTIAKNMLGISGTNFGDVSIGSFSYVSFAQGLTITAAQVLQAGWGDTTNPGMVGTTHQVFAGDKRTTGNLGTDQYLQLRGGSLLSIGSTANAGHTLIFSGGQGGTYSQLSNNGLGILSWTLADPGFYRTVTNAGATLNIQDRFVEITTGSTNQTLAVGWGTGNTSIVFNVTKIDSGLGSVTIQSSRLINGVTNFTFGSQWEAHKIVDNGIALTVIT